MSDLPHYELIDFGEGRKLERFGEWLIDRPCPAAESSVSKSPKRRHKASLSLSHSDGGAAASSHIAWEDAGARFERDRQLGDANVGRWKVSAAPDTAWTLPVNHFTLELRLTPFGHLGVFPEQAGNWSWIGRQVARAGAPRVLNLFAYTGASTLAAAAAGAQVTHVDAARNVLGWARRNAELSGLQNAPIRWIAEDAARFVQRELKRGNDYQGIILDPPSYGHGPKNEIWKIEQHLKPLLRDCARLLQGTHRFMLLTCHSPNFGPAELQASVADAVLGTCQAGAIGQPMVLRTSDGRRLPSGAMVRWAE
jgi:23S rRNA (cytosine1962-C5)-methyltransferase